MRDADPDLLDFLTERGARAARVLDIGCGTGIQLVAIDYVCNQFSYHDMDHPEAMIAEACRVAKRGGRLVISDIAPHEMMDTALYEWFPDSLASDLEAHPSRQALEEFARAAGFADVRVQVQTVGGPVTLKDLAEKYSRKEGCSQLNAPPQEVFDAQLQGLRAAAHASPTQLASDHTALLRLTASHP